MQKLKVKYIDMYPAYQLKTGMEYDIFTKHFDVQLTDENPDIVVSGGFGGKYLSDCAPKLCINVENNIIHQEYVDIAICPNVLHTKRYFQNSNIVMYDGFSNLLTKNQRHPLYTPNKQKFCVFMYHNDTALARKIFCKKLMQYKQVDCLGRVMRNTQIIKPKDISDNTNWKQEQLHIYNQYKFTIAFENSSAPGYVCEKILQPLLVGSIPIYWGGEDVKQYFNPDGFIHVNDFKSFEDCIAYVQKVDNDPELYQKYLDAPPILPTSKLHHMTLDKMADWLYEQINDVLQNPDQCISNITDKDKKKWHKWYKKSQRVARLKQLFLYNVPMPIWQKCMYSSIEIIKILHRKYKKVWKK